MAKKKAKATGAGKREPITGKRRRNIVNAFRKNKQAIKKRFRLFRRNLLTVNQLENQVLQLNGQLRDYLLRGNGEEPKSAEGGRP